MRFMSLAIPIIVVYMLTAFVEFSDYQQETWVEMQERHLDTAMNFAADAAVEYMTENSADLGLDYNQFEFVKADPSLALEMFKRVLLRNLDYGDSEQNDAYIENCMPVFVVATYDGYYLARERAVSDKDNEGVSYRLVFNPKMPYTYEKKVNGVSYLYALNLGLEDAIRYYGDSNGGHYDRVLTDGLLTFDEQRLIISSRISDDMIVNLWDIRGGQSIDSTLLVPADMTTWTSTNPINATTVLAYVDGLNLGTGVNATSFAIGGSRIVHENFCVCYEYNGKKVYCFTGKQPTGVKILESFVNPTKAAEAGYEFDMTYFDRY